MFSAVTMLFTMTTMNPKPSDSRLFQPATTVPNTMTPTASLTHKWCESVRIPTRSHVLHVDFCSFPEQKVFKYHNEHRTGAANTKKHGHIDNAKPVQAHINVQEEQHGHGQTPVAPSEWQALSFMSSLLEYSHVEIRYSQWRIQFHSLNRRSMSKSNKQCSVKRNAVACSSPSDNYKQGGRPTFVLRG